MSMHVCVYISIHHPTKYTNVFLPQCPPVSHPKLGYYTSILNVCTLIYMYLPVQVSFIWTSLECRTTITFYVRDILVYGMVGL